MREGNEVSLQPIQTRTILTASKMKGGKTFLQCAMTGSALSADPEKEAWLCGKVRRTALKP